MEMVMGVRAVQVQSQSQSQSQSQRLTQKQSVLLEQLLEQRLELRELGPIKPSKGLKGLRIADAMLKSQNSAGILIGGVAEAVWNQRRKPEELDERKDVDVLVLNTDFQLREKFEGGIDWWLPRTGRVKLMSEISSFESTVNWWQNGNAVVLHFRFEPKLQLSPGLHFLSREDVLEMRWQEAMVRFTEQRVGVDVDLNVLKSHFRKRLEKHIKLQMPKFLREEFKGQIHYEPYVDNYREAEPVDISAVELKQLAGIDRLMKQS